MPNDMITYENAIELLNNKKVTVLSLNGQPVKKVLVRSNVIHFYLMNNMVMPYILRDNFRYALEEGDYDFPQLIIYDFAWSCKISVGG